MITYLKKPVRNSTTENTNTNPKEYDIIKAIQHDSWKAPLLSNFFQEIGEKTCSEKWAMTSRSSQGNNYLQKHYLKTLKSFSLITNSIKYNYKVMYFLHR